MGKQPTPLLLLTCLFLFQTLVTSKITHLNNFTDQEALLAFKSHITSYTNDTLFNNWNPNTSFCNWIGVSCSRHRQRVTKLDLPSMGLEGTIPPVISNLSFLAFVNLSYNNFHGHLPHELGRLHRLKVLALTKNRVEGTIPPSLADLPALNYLSLSINNLSGAIPLAIFNISSLVVLGLSSNSLYGRFPTDMGRFLPNLERLDIGGNQMSGLIPISLVNASKLTLLGLDNNRLNGSIPYTLGYLDLEVLYLHFNNLTGTIPSTIFNLSNLIVLILANNQLTGHLPLDIGNWLPTIVDLVLSHNQLTGKIPLSLGNASKLELLELSTNDFSGSVPTTIGKLPLLQILNLGANQFTNEPGTNELNFLTDITNCRFLEYLIIASNPIRGILPSSIGNFSILKEFSAFECKIEGTIPREFGNLTSLITIWLDFNNLRGAIPSTIGMLGNLQRLVLTSNNLEGSIPVELGQLQNMGELFLGWNMLSGVIPDLFQNHSRLKIIYLNDNKLSGIPSSLWILHDLLELSLSHNALTGVLPQEVGYLKNLVKFNFSLNQFMGTIPNSLGYLQMLQSLDLSSNLLVGPIPQSFGDLISIEFMNLSSNHLNGKIPRSLENLSYLEVLNLSFNRLEGEIPTGGVFTNFTLQSFIGNFELCSTPKLHVKLNVSVCSTHVNKSRVGSLLRKIIISVVLTTLVVCFSFLIIYYGKKKKKLSSIVISPTRVHKMVSYQELLHATDNFSESNLIGVGSFGSVYKGEMIDGSLIAVKVLKIQSQRSWESFEVECEVMRNVRHRNLVKVITSCSNLDFRALILQFMPNGSLDQWLYSPNNYMSLRQRIEILIDVASAMEYLHHHYSVPVVHCDLKPSNVLLDEDMVAHVSDFGIAKLLDENKSAATTNTLGTIGHVAPEYGVLGKVSIKGDVYSYGILLLEMLIRKKPTDNMFIEGLSLRQWVNAAFPNAIMDLVDMDLLRETGSSSENGKEVYDPSGKLISSLVSIAEVGLLCSKELAEERITMKDVVVRLIKIKNEFLSR